MLTRGTTGFPPQPTCSCHPSLVVKPSRRLLLVIITVNWAEMQHCLWCKTSFLLLCRTVLLPVSELFSVNVLTFLVHDEKVCSSILTKSKKQHPLRNCHFYLWTLEIATSLASENSRSQQVISLHTRCSGDSRWKAEGGWNCAYSGIKVPQEKLFSGLCIKNACPCPEQ